MSALTTPAAVTRGAAVAAVVVLGALASATAASALGEVAVTPKAVVPGGSVTVEGRCPEPVRGAYVRATVGVDAIGRFVVVPVEENGFSARFRARGVDGYADPAPGDKLRAQVSCATDEAFVASVGTVKVQVVETVLGAVDDAPAKKASATVPATASATTGGAGDDTPISPWVPTTAFAVAAFGTAGAYVVSRRNERRLAAAADERSQRAAEPRRDAR